MIGAGFAGLYMLHRLRQLGFSALAFEAGTDVGGTWYWNRYPGARCDVESIEYQYSFSDELAQEWTWTERYAAQPEIFAYARFVADRLELRPHITFDSRVAEANYDDAARRWTVRTDRGETVTCRFVLAGTGSLSVPSRPTIPGLETFQGEVLHTGEWPDAPVDFHGKRVAVIGTGSSGVQAIPLIAEQASHLHVFQRTATYSIPAFNAPVPAKAAAAQKARFAEMKADARKSRTGLFVRPNPVSALSVTPEERDREFEARWSKGGFHMASAFIDLLTNEDANETLAEFIRRKIRTALKDPSLAEKLLPRDYPCGAKRLCLDTNFYATFNRPNVTLVDLRETGELVGTPRGLKTGAVDYTFDAVVLATGFDAMTGALTRIDIRGRNGITLKDAWSAGPLTYLGLGVAGFPNFFILAGPGSPSVLANVIMAIEQQVDWVADLLVYMRAKRMETIEPTPEAQAAWVEAVNTAAAATLYPKAGSWYLGANIPGKPRVFMPYCGGLNVYAQRCGDVAEKGYEGFNLEPLEVLESA